jgi:hypothetical protein
MDQMSDQMCGKEIKLTMHRVLPRSLIRSWTDHRSWEIPIMQPSPQLRAVVCDYGGVLSLLPAEQDRERLTEAASAPSPTLLTY